MTSFSLVIRLNIWLLVGIGGFIGAVSRYFLSGLIQNGIITFPVGTLGVNIIGSFFLGLIMYGSEYEGFLSQEARIFLTLGVLGAFTTMSTFSYESFKLLENDQLLLFGINLLATVFLTILAVYLGKLAILTILGR